MFRRFLSEFDSDDGKESDVLPMTIELGLAMEWVPVTLLKEQRKEDIIKKLYKPLDGPLSRSIRVRLFDSVQLCLKVSSKVNIVQIWTHSTVHESLPHSFGGFADSRRDFTEMFASCYLKSLSTESHELRKKLLEHFIEVSGSLANQKNDAEIDEVFKDFKDMTVLYWGSSVDPK